MRRGLRVAESMPLTAAGKADRRGLPPSASTQLRDHPLVPPRSPTEHQLAQIWERVFGVSQIGTEDNFFDLGGDSLRAAEIVLAIEESFGRTLQPAILLQASTVADLASVLIEGEGAPAEPVTALRTAGNRAPIFFLHNDAGRGLYTHALAGCLDRDRAFYAVHRDGIDAMSALPTVEDLAADRIRALRSVRPHGPYVLGGHCHGGLIALEMARQLRAQGEEIELVLMVDTDAPTARLRSLRRVLNAADRLRGRALRGLQERFALALRVGREIGWRARYYQRRAGMLARAGMDAQIEFACRKLSARRSGKPEKTSPAWTFHADAPRRVDPRRAYLRAFRHYVPSRYAGRVALFRAEQFPFERPDLGWSDYLPKLRIEVVPGDHHSCITRHVVAFAACMNKVLSVSHRTHTAPDTAARPMAPNSIEPKSAEGLENRVASRHTPA